MMDKLDRLREPKDYFRGKGGNSLTTPTNVLLFLRKTKDTLQQRALQNRSHHRYVLAFNYETEGCVHLDNLVLSLKPGQGMLIMPYQFHHFSRLHSEKLKWFFCTFDLEGGALVEPLRNRVVDVGVKTKQAIDELLKEWFSKESMLRDEQIQVAALRLVFCMVQDCQAEKKNSFKQPPDSLLRLVNRLLLEWRGRTVVVADLAEALGMSESRLRVTFRKSAGISLGGYIQNYKINRAMELLKTTQLPIADIAEESGFGSPQAFSRIFKKKAGYTPREYRNR